MITETKRIRTKKGDPMMFATLDDLEGSVELLDVRQARWRPARTLLAADSIVLVRGRVDHKDRDKTCIVVQQIEPFEPTPEEVNEAVEQAARKAGARRARSCSASTRRRSPPRRSASSRTCSRAIPGESEVVIELSTSIGARRLKLGADFRVTHGAALHAELDALLGSAMLPDGERPGESQRIAASA